MTAKRWAFEDFVEGATISFGSKTVTAEEIIEFAGEFDAQPMHLEEDAGKASLLGGLGASGWHTCCMFMRMLCDGFLLDSTSQGSPGIDYAKWKKPVIAGDMLTGRCTVIGTRTSKSRPGLGFVTIRSALLNQRGEEVFELQNTGMFLARGAAR
jgi:acyl dehydratase